MGLNEPLDVSPSEICRQFLQWLYDAGYELAVDCCPYDSEEGGYQRTDGCAIDYVDEFEVSLGRKLTTDEFFDVEFYAFDLGEVANTRRWFVEYELDRQAEREADGDD